MRYIVMSRKEDDSIWDKILAWFAALYAAIRQGSSNLVQYYRNLLADYGYTASTSI